MNDDNAAIAGQAVYSKSVLSVYDVWVLGISNTFFWKCPTKLIRHEFEKNVTNNHLDVGVGTGYYLKNCLTQTERRVGLVDLNENSLESAAAAIADFSPEVYRRNVLEPLDLDCPRFDSVSINYLLHCVPGGFSEKGVMFAHLKEVMNPGGVIFGSTILGVGVQHNLIGKRLMQVYNQKGIFDNTRDDLQGLRTALESQFKQVNIQVVGCVALFSAVK
ncbi:class I SAM-dependent methyltransferase [Algicola sagamiensis]|uniref:class I SAM-dependent methyltransferase n=1 Tax=Algicola sagamiensis TaxID=163869 RepID=UPI00035D27DE|nr:class I SAM-dependent methyltransferase [Algicola sagamiensis]